MATQQPLTRATEAIPVSNPVKSSGGGVLAVSAAATKKSLNNATASRGSAKAPAPRLKLVVRRLAPGLTQDEFVSALGTEWNVGAGKIEWMAYKAGKISKDPSKPSKPSRAYLKVKDQAFIGVLSDKIRQITFQDAKNSTNDPCLIGPPSLEFAPYSRVPGGRLRKDGRQGTIDQDPEFIAFLLSLTEPITKPSVGDAAEGDAKAEKVTSTPLIQYIKEKKANKAKEKAEKAAEKSAKAQKEKEAKDSKKPEPKKVSVMKKEKEDAKGAASAAQAQKAIKEAARVANKQAAAVKAQDTAVKPEIATSKDAITPQKQERERRPPRSAIQTLQRDLAQANSPRSERRAKNAKDTGAADATKASVASTKPTEASPAPVSPMPKETMASPAPSSAQKTPTVPPSGPKNSKQPSTPTQQQPTPKPNSTKPNPRPSAGAKSAFLKHANPSQGVTEPLLLSAFTLFGKVTKCEIDKRKGFGYVDFEDPESLKTAMAASPLAIGDKGAKVVVLERKGGPGPAASKNTTPMSRVPSTSTAQPSSPAPSATSTTAPQEKSPTPAATSTKTPNAAKASGEAPATASPPTAPSASSSPAPPTAFKGGQGGRGGQGRGGGRGGFSPGGRGGRGGLRGRGGPRGGSSAAATPGATTGSAVAQASSPAPASNDANTKDKK